jgi:hypothetical protein
MQRIYREILYLYPNISIHPEPTQSYKIYYSPSRGNTFSLSLHHNTKTKKIQFEFRIQWQLQKMPVQKTPKNKKQIGGVINNTFATNNTIVCFTFTSQLLFLENEQLLRLSSWFC